MSTTTTDAAVQPGGDIGGHAGADKPDSAGGMQNIGGGEPKADATSIEQQALQDLSNTYNTQQHQPLRAEDNGASAWQKSGTGGMPAYAQMPIDLTAAPNAAAAAAYGRVPLVYHQQPHQQQQQHHSMDAYHQAAAAGGSFQPVYQFPTGYATGGAAAGGAAGAGGAAMYAAAPDVYHQNQMAYAPQMTAYGAGGPPPTAYARPPPGGQHYMHGAYASNSDTAKGPMSLFDNATENYTAKWVSSTASIPPDLKSSPEHNSNPNSPIRDFQTANWSATQSSSNQSHHTPLQHTSSMDEFAAGASATSGFSPPPSEATLDQHMNALSLSASNAFNAAPSFANYYTVSHPQSVTGGHQPQQTPVQQPMGGYFNAQQLPHQQQVAGAQKTPSAFYGQEYPQMGGSSTAGSATTMGTMPVQQQQQQQQQQPQGGGGGGGSTWADMVKKNGNVSEGVTRICVQPPPQQQVSITQGGASGGGPPHEDHGGANRFGRPGGRYGNQQGGPAPYRGGTGGYYSGGYTSNNSPNGAGGGRFRAGGRNYNGTGPGNQGYASPKYGGVPSAGHGHQADSGGADHSRDVDNGYGGAGHYDAYSHTGAGSSPSVAQQYSNYSAASGYVPQTRIYPAGQWGNQFFVGAAPSYGSRQSPVTMTQPFYTAGGPGGPPTVAAPLPAAYQSAMQFYPPGAATAAAPPQFHAPAMPPLYLVGLPPPPPGSQSERFRNTWLDQDQVPPLQFYTERELSGQVINHNNQILMARQSKYPHVIRPGGLVSYNCQSFNPQAAFYPGGGYAPRRRFFGPRPGIQPRGKGGSPLKSPQDKSLQSSNASSSGHTVTAETSDEGVNVVIRPPVVDPSQFEGEDGASASKSPEAQSKSDEEPSKSAEDTEGTTTAATQSSSVSKEPVEATSSSKAETSTASSSGEKQQQYTATEQQKPTTTASADNQVLQKQSEITEKPLDAAPAAPPAYAAVVARKASPKQTKADGDASVVAAAEVKAGV